MRALLNAQGCGHECSLPQLTVCLLYAKLQVHATTHKQCPDCLAYCKLSSTSWAELKPGSLPGQVVCTLLALLGCLISCCQELRLRLLLQPLLLSCCCLCRGQLLRFLPTLAHGCSMMAGVVPHFSLP